METVIRARSTAASCTSREEAFLCGTGAQMSPIVEIDHRPVGDGEVGPITRKPGAALLRHRARQDAAAQQLGHAHLLIGASNYGQTEAAATQAPPLLTLFSHVSLGFQSVSSRPGRSSFPRPIAWQLPSPNSRVARVVARAGSAGFGCGVNRCSIAQSDWNIRRMPRATASDSSGRRLLVRDVLAASGASAILAAHGRRVAGGQPVSTCTPATGSACARARDSRPVGGAQDVRATARTERRPRALVVPRRAHHGQQPDGRPPRLGPDVQGPVPALPRHARARTSATRTASTARACGSRSTSSASWATRASATSRPTASPTSSTCASSAS